MSLKVIVHLIIIDHWNQTARLYGIQVTVTVINGGGGGGGGEWFMSSGTRLYKICESQRTWTGTFANGTNPDQTQ